MITSIKVEVKETKSLRYDGEHLGRFLLQKCHDPKYVRVRMISKDMSNIPSKELGRLHDSTSLREAAEEFLAIADYLDEQNT
jgi:hypothetical protein